MHRGATADIIAFIGANVHANFNAYSGGGLPSSGHEWVELSG
jgi:hypothetical protein